MKAHRSRSDGTGTPESDPPGGDDCEFLVFWGQLLPAAMRLVHNALDPVAMGEDDAELLSQVRALEKKDGPTDDPPAERVESALWSAYSSYRQRVWADGLHDAADLEELASQLIRIAYNRWQRRHHSAKRLGREATRGGDERTSLDNAVSAADPVREAERAELVALVQKVVEDVSEGFDETERTILISHLNAERNGPHMSQAKIAEQVGCSQATVSRVIQAFRDRVTRRLTESGVTSN